MQPQQASPQCSPRRSAAPACSSLLLMRGTAVRRAPWRQVPRLPCCRACPAPHAQSRRYEAQGHTLTGPHPRACVPACVCACVPADYMHACNLNSTHTRTCTMHNMHMHRACTTPEPPRWGSGGGGRGGVGGEVVTRGAMANPNPNPNPYPNPNTPHTIDGVRSAI